MYKIILYVPDFSFKEYHKHIYRTQYIGYALPRRNGFETRTELHIRHIFKCLIHFSAPKSI